LRRWFLSVFFPIVFLFNSSIILFCDIFILFFELVLSFGSVRRILIFTLFEIVFIQITSFINRWSCLIIFASITTVGVLWIFVITLLDFVGACIRWAESFSSQKIGERRWIFCCSLFLFLLLSQFLLLFELPQLALKLFLPF